MAPKSTERLERARSKCSNCAAVPARSLLLLPPLAVPADVAGGWADSTTLPLPSNLRLRSAGKCCM